MALSFPATLSELLRARAHEAPEGGYRFTRDGAVVESVSFEALDRDARAIAARLQAEGVGRGASVLLLYPPGLDFIRAFFGCLYAGAAAVPVYPPNPARLERTLPRLRKVAASSGARLVLTTKDIQGVVGAIFPLAPELASCTWIPTDGPQDDAAAWRPPAVGPSDLALLQYTSGSTGEPRGVMITHGNLLHNQGLIRQAFAQRERDVVGVTWLPVYHDMGLIGMVMQPLYMGGSCVLMSPLEFLQSPYRWLAAISEYRGSLSGAPNFAYDLCVRKISDEQLATLDLSSWRAAFCGAEPVKAATLARFAERFGRAGFKASSLLPCYGLAEGSLLVAGTSRPEGVVAIAADEEALRNGTMAPAKAGGGRSVVGCGMVAGDQEVVVVVDGVRCPPGRIGEIWIRGASVGLGYWQRPEETAQTFGGRLADGEGPFLRTGDLGTFGHDGELFILGRSKDLLIVRGLNHHPHDIEASVEAAWPALRPGCSVAVAIEEADGEGVAVIAEYDPRGARGEVAWEAVVDAVRAAASNDHDLALRTVAIVAAGQIPKTSSGKLQRSEARRRFLAQELEVLHRWDAPRAEPEVVDDAPLRTFDEIRAFMTSWLSKGLGRKVPSTAKLSSLGLDSLDIVRLMEALGGRMGVDVDPELALDYPTIDLLAAHLAEAAER